MTEEQQEQAGAPLSDTVLVLTEDALTDGDAQRIVQLHAPERLEYRVLVPADTEHSVLAEVIDHLSLLELKEAARSLRPRRAREARMDAGQQLAASVEALERAGATASGQVTEDDPIPMLREAVRRHGAREVVVVTQPHAVQDTLHTDWASRARDQVGVPVLHVYGGTTFLG